MKERCVEYKGGKCEHCKQVYPAVCYDFHHIDPEARSFAISGARLKKSWDNLKAEMDKCALLCANCRRAIVYGEWQLPAGKVEGVYTCTTEPPAPPLTPKGNLS